MAHNCHRKRDEECKGVLVSSSCYKKKIHALLISNRNLSLTVLKVRKSEIRMLVLPGSGEGPLPGCKLTTSQCPQVAKGARELSDFSL